MAQGKKYALIACAAIALSGCASLNGVEEFAVYDAAVTSVSDGSRDLATELSVAEKKRGVALIDGGIGGKPVAVNGANAGAPTFGVAPTFQPEHAAFFSATANPPLTASILGAVSALTSYNKALSVYVEGRGLEAATTSVAAIGTDVTLAAKALGLAVPGANTALQVVLEGAGAAGRIGSRRAFREELMARGAGLSALLDELRKASGEVFRALTREQMRALKKNPGEEEKKALLDSVHASRAAVAEWVILVDLAQAALTDLRAAVEETPSLAASAAAGADLAAEARVRADAIKRILAQN